MPDPDPGQLYAARTRRRDASVPDLILIVGSSAVAPLLGGWLVSHFDWRALFACTAPAGLAFAVLAMLALPDSGNVVREERSATSFWPYLCSRLPREHCIS